MSRLQSISNSHPTVSPHPPICLRTNADGRINVPNDWLQVFSEAHERFDAIYLQTRHAYARLVAKTAPPQLDWIEENRLAASSNQRLLLRPNAHSSLYARVESCSCCGSPGRIEFRNEHGHEFLQLCSPQSIPASDWALFVQALAHNQTAAPHYSNPGSFPKIPGNATALSFHPTTLVTILEMLCDYQAGIETTLVTKESIHRREIRAATVEFDDETLGVYSPSASFQLGVAAVRCLYTARRSDGESVLFAAGPGNAQLLALEPAADPHSKECFSHILQDLNLD